MSQTVAEAAAAYRKRKADKIARYEAALREIIDATITPIENPHSGVLNGKELIRVHAVARAALNPAPSRLHSKGEVND